MYVGQLSAIAAAPAARALRIPAPFNQRSVTLIATATVRLTARRASGQRSARVEMKSSLDESIAVATTHLQLAPSKT
jgi:hypothetical protein